MTELQLKNAIKKAEKPGFKIFPMHLSCTYSYKDRHFKINGYHNRNALFNDHKAVYVVKDRQTTERFDVIHNLPQIVIEGKKASLKDPDVEWKITKQSKGFKATIHRFLNWKNRYPHQKSSAHKLGELIFSALLGINSGYFFISGLFGNIWHLMIGIPLIIYLVYQTIKLTYKNYQHKKEFVKKHGMSPEEWFKKSMDQLKEYKS